MAQPQVLVAGSRDAAGLARTMAVSRRQWLHRPDTTNLVPRIFIQRLSYNRMV
jgi:hypothetical protein